MRPSPSGPRDPAPDERPKPLPALRRRFRGCLLGGAVGDALGAPVEFMSLAEIRAQFGRAGITELTTAFDRKGAITDDTQMTLFTAEGLLRAYVQTGGRDVRAVLAAVAHAYTRWLRTQGVVPAVADTDADGWLYEQRELHAQRVPGATCISALQHMATLGQRAVNDSKGCGGVMRVAPVGLWCARLDDGVSPERVARKALELGAEAAGLTHGHPTGRLAAGAFASLVALLVRDVALPEAVVRVRTLVARYPGHAETLNAIDRAQALARSGDALRPEGIVSLGEGWVAEEALAIALAAALAAPDFETGVRLAVNHDGDSDSTAAIAGNILGALHGLDAIPQRWTAGLEARRVIAEMADDLATFPEWPLGEFVAETDLSDYYRRRYPPS
ncbi:MAG TPA: ADP-ribosylglycohydrolase family protein [Casimicrobiaceae bacterium]